MPCEPIKFGNQTAILCGGRRNYCAYCRAVSKFQCDFPVSKYKSGKRKGHWKSCDRHLCEKCTKKGVSENVDFCREHYGRAKAAYERRINK